ncbi:hypothetical protein [Paenibacillus sp. P22]|uniref:hypothetical protein n=1 Tax=Paenibacillus sp. P22 TaxID=483908 RepID=UPI0004366443|nr:hypothetical protein [Paenibacillus sp. P22]CDN46191.1 hypothetical protein BN871_LI_00050 [Paenibacillus sp. P22]
MDRAGRRPGGRADVRDGDDDGRHQPGIRTDRGLRSRGGRAFAEAAKAREQLQAAQKYEAELRQLQKKYGVQPSAPAEAQTAFAGDAESSGASSGDVSAWNGYSAGDERYRLPGVAPLDSDTGVNRLADGTAGMLQSVSSSGIRMIVTLFDSFTK